MKERVFGLLATTIVATILCSTPIAVYAEECNDDALIGEPAPVAAEEPAPEVEQPAPIVDETPALIAVARDINVCIVYNAAGEIIKMFPVSTGREGHRTPLGTYSIYEHTDNGGYHLMVDGTYARYCMRFKKGGYMFHTVCYAYKGAPEPIQEEVDALGTSVSRGCVRLSVADAEWLYTHTTNGCTVVIADVGQQQQQQQPQ